MSENLIFGLAIEALKEGKCLTRAAWVGTDKACIFKQVPAQIDEPIIPKMQSLPDAAKKLFTDTFNDEAAQIKSIYYRNQIALVGLSNTIDSYSASAEDIFAEDWLILE